MKVNWDDDIPNGKMPKMATKPPTRKKKKKTFQAMQGSQFQAITGVYQLAGANKGSPTPGVDGSPWDLLGIS